MRRLQSIFAGDLSPTQGLALAVAGFAVAGGLSLAACGDGAGSGSASPSGSAAPGKSSAATSARSSAPGKATSAPPAHDPSANIPCQTDSDCPGMACGPCDPGTKLVWSDTMIECFRNPCKYGGPVCGPDKLCVVNDKSRKDPQAWGSASAAPK